MSYLLDFAGRPIPQTEQSEARQVKNSAGGYVYKIDQWQQLERFLILGTEGGTYYASERDITKENITNVKACIASDGKRVVRTCVSISDSGRAPKNDPAIYTLALVAQTGSPESRKAARDAIPFVCRTGTHLYHYVNFINILGGWGRGTRRSVANWFTNQKVDDLAYQLVKYQSRDGWSSRDVLRMAHTKPPTDSHDVLFRWATGNPIGDGVVLPRIVEGFERTKKATSALEVAYLVDEYDLPREAVPTKWLTDKLVWRALCMKMPIGATLRNLATMTRVGLFDSMAMVELVTERITDIRTISRGRVHPIAILSALLTYKQGHGERSDKTWIPNTRIVDALDGAFYSSFGCISATNKHHVLALDISGSMHCGTIAGVPGLTPAIGAAAMAMVTHAVERRCTFAGFGTHYQGLELSSRRRLDDNVKYLKSIGNFGGTDCALPMIHAMKSRADVDVFVIYTDNETWQGKIHADLALRDYRQACGHDAKLIVVGMTSTGFSIADPQDAGMMDVVGFDTSAPSIMADFARS